MKNSTKQLLVSALVLTTALSPVTSTYAATGANATASSTSVSGYHDLNTAAGWAKEAILQAQELGLMSGDPTGNFRPLDTITRQELAVLLTKLKGLKADTSAVSSYKDVTSAHWGVAYIEAVRKAGLMTGDGNGTFRPDDAITREELAVVLTRAANADVHGKGASLAVGDSHQVSDWAKDYVQAAIELGLMKGDGTNFNPAQKAQRQEVAMVAINFVNALQQPAVLSAVTETGVTINGTQYAIAANLKGLLNVQNAKALQGAKLRFQAANGTIQDITALELTNSGTAAASGEAEFSHNLVLDGQGATINGNLKIGADFISVQNLTVTGDMEIGKELQNDFYSKNLNVLGNTIVNGGDNNTVVFEDANLKTVEINKQDVRVEPKGKTKLEQVNVNSNSTIEADPTVTIPKLTIQDGAEHVNLKGTVGSVEVKNHQASLLTGEANISNVTVSTSALFTLSTSGKVEKVDVANSTGTLALGDAVKINNLVLPDGKAAQDVVRDYNNKSGQVGNVNGNPQNGNQNGNNQDEKPDPSESNTAKVAADKAALTDSKLLGQNQALTTVFYNLVLPTKGANDSTITWSSSNSNVLSNTGVVTRPAYLAGDATVTLTATIKKGNVQDTKTFTVTVKKMDETDVEAISIAKGKLTESQILNGNTSSSNVTGKLSLPTNGADGTHITWTSDKPTSISGDGTVTRSLTDDVTVKLTATITKGNASDTKEFTFTVLHADQAVIKDAVEKDRTALEIGFGAGDSSSSVSQGLTLPASGANGSKITWTSDQPSIVSAAGAVTRPAFLLGDATVTLTAQLALGGEQSTKSFTITVKKLNATNAEAVSIAKNSLTEQALLNGNASSTSIRGDLSLPTSGAEGTTISWASDHSDTIATDGTVHPSVTGDVTVKLTATITKGDTSDTKEFLFKVLQSDSAIQDALNKDRDALQIGFATGDTLGSVTQNLILPGAGANGTTITWATSNPNLVTATGTVTRPQYGAAAHNVILTATIAKDGYFVTKTFNLDIKFANVKVQLLSFNDLHGKIDQTYEESITGTNGPKVNIGRMDYLATHIKEHQAENPNNTLILHVGDATGGSSPVSALFLDEPTVETMQKMGVAGGTVGNHEFDRGTQELLRLVNGGASENNPNYAGMGFPLVVSNVVYKANKQHVLPPYFIKEIGGVKVGFIGVVTRSAAGMVMPAGIADIEFTDEAQAVNEAAAELKAQGIHALVVMAHMDLTQDSPTTVSGPAADLAKNVDPDIDVILAAHNHKVANGTVNGKLLVQAYEYGKAFADVDLEIDPATQDIVSKKAEVVYNTQDVTPDPAVKGVIDKYLEKAGPTLHSVVGTASTKMEGGYTATGDNALGNLIADSMRVKMKSDFAMMNGGGIRTNLNQGPIKWEDLFNILPFNNILTTVSIKGSALTDIINTQLSVRYGADYSIAGFKYQYDYTTSKVTQITKEDGTPIDPNAIYTLTVNNFMATATSAKYAIIGKSAIDMVTGPEDLPALIDYVKSFNGNVPAPALGRITISNNMVATNVVGAGDTLTVDHLKPGHAVKVYNSSDAASTDSKLLGQATVASGATSATVTGLNLNPTGGTVYVTITVSGQEGVRFPVQYGAEVNGGNPVPTISVGTATLNEADANDGTVSGTEVLTLTNGTFAADISAADVVAQNLPAGLTYQVTRNSDTQLTVTFGGKATAHAAANSVANVYFTVAKAKVNGATSNVTTSSFAINFKDAPLTNFTDIAVAKGYAANTPVLIHGIITADNSAIGGGKLSTFVQDATGGVNVFAQSIPAGLDLKEGDEVTIAGKMTSYSKLTEIAPDANGIQVLSHNNPLPVAKSVALADLVSEATAEPYEGQLLKVHGYLSSIPDTSTGTAWNLTFIDNDFNTVVLRIMEPTKTLSSLHEGTWYDITGVLGQYNDTYQLTPRKASDIVTSAVQDPAPSTQGAIKSAIVQRGVDGDTIKLTTPVFGATNVRFLSIDTPETVYNNLSQGPHGDAAHVALDQLLPPNTPVELHFGSEPLDKYGRLLAHVFKDGQDINLKMVEEGYATTYQIYPNLEGFDAYANALKAAKQNKKGIWNPKDPLLEMPFVFRARMDGNTPLSKPVGDYYTHEYVDPDLWYTIPAENRVFFWNVADATKANFTKKNYANNDTTLFSDVYQVDTVNATVSGFPYGVNVDTVKAMVRAVTGATVQFFNGSTEITSGTLSTGNTIVVTAKDGSKKTYTITTDAIPVPVAVTNVTATSKDTNTGEVGGVTNTIRWTDSQYGASYEIFRSTTGNFQDAVSLGIVPPARQVFTDSDVIPGTTYTYFVVAGNTSGSTPSSAVDVKAADDIVDVQVLNAPTNVAVTSTDINNATVGVNNVVTWSDSVGPTGTTYNILRSKTNDVTNATKLATVGAGVQTYTDMTRDLEATFYYFVEAINGAQKVDSPGVQVTTAKDYHIMISEIYGNGGNATSTYKYDYIELYNPSDSDITMTDWMLQYQAATTTTWPWATSNSVILNGTIKAHGYFLIKFNSNSTVGLADLPGSNAFSTTNLSGSAGKVALLSQKTLTLTSMNDLNLVDFVGFGSTASSFEGSGPVTATQSNTTSLARKLSSDNGKGTDTNDNARDFVSAAPNPHAAP